MVRALPTNPLFWGLVIDRYLSSSCGKVQHGHSPSVGQHLLGVCYSQGDGREDAIDNMTSANQGESGRPLYPRHRRYNSS